MLLRIAAFVPFDGYTPATTGIGGDLGGVFELGPIILEPRIGLRRSVDSRTSWYLQVPMDLGVFVRFVDGDVFPIVGGGAGLRVVAQHSETRHSVGTVVWTRHTESSTDTMVGFGAFARVGIGFRLPQSTLILITADYDVSFGKLRDRDVHSAGLFSFGVGL